jgi:hypothetical protein
MNRIGAQQACAQDRQCRVLCTGDNDLTREPLAPNDNEFVHACVFLICPALCRNCLVDDGGAATGAACFLSNSH